MLIQRRPPCSTTWMFGSVAACAAWPSTRVRERLKRGLGRFGMTRSERVVDHRWHMSDSTSHPDALAAYTGARPEVQALVPRQARRILDLGCAAGALGAALKSSLGAAVTGVELDPAHARDAARVLDRVVT